MPVANPEKSRPEKSRVEELDHLEDCDCEILPWGAALGMPRADPNPMWIGL